MPDNNDDNKGGSGDGAAADAAADDNKGSGDGTGDGGADAGAAAAANSSGDGTGDGEETVTIKKSDLKKIEEDRDNYKKGLLGKKADERNLKGGDGDGKGGDDDGKGKDGKGKDGEGDGTGDDKNVIDEKKITDTATAASTKVLRDAGEKTAKRAFLKAHSEYIDDAEWTSLMSHLTFRGGEMTHDEIMDRMEAALFEHKRSTGKLEEHLKAEHDRGVQEGRIQSDVESGHGTGGSGDRSGDGKGSGTLSPKGEEMARHMHTDPEKVKKVDISKDNVIDVTK